MSFFIGLVIGLTLGYLLSRRVKIKKILDTEPQSLIQNYSNMKYQEAVELLTTIQKELMIDKLTRRTKLLLYEFLKKDGQDKV